MIVACGAIYRLMLISVVVLTHLRLDAGMVAEITEWPLIALWGVLIWHCGRRLLGFGLVLTLVLLLVSQVVRYYSDWPASAILTPILQAAEGTT